MTTATRRLRRSGVASFAAAVTAGVTILATSGSAFAALGTILNQIDGTTGATTVFAGTAAQAVGSDDLNMTNVFNIGDTLTLTVAKAPGCGTTNGAVGFASAPTVTATGPFIGTFGAGGASADAATAIAPKFTAVTQSSAGACTIAGVKDQLLVTFTSSAAGAAADNFLLVVGGQSLNVGSAVTTGAITETTVPSSGTAPAAAVTVATVANTKASVSAVTTAASSLAVQTVGVGTLTLADVGAAAVIGNPIFLTATAGTVFTAALAPTVTGPTGSTWTVTGQGTVTLTLTPGGTAFPATNNTFTVTGLTLDVPAGTGTYTILAKFGGASPGTTTIGAAVTVITVTGQSRIGGIDRYATSGQLYNTAFAASTKIVLASGFNFPDALSATYLAKTLTTGVLLTDPNVLQQSTSLVLTNNVITTIYIVGGTAAVSANVQNAISALHVGNDPNKAFLTVVRVAGADRYATNNAVDLFNGATTGTTAIVATGQNFADALAVGPAVYNKTIPLVLTGTGSLDANAQSTLVNLGIHSVIIVGGTAAISAAVETAIKALPGVSIAYRIAGADRTLTASQIATWETQGLPAATPYPAAASLGFGFVAASKANLARGDGFADALSAGAVAGVQAQVILLTDNPTTLGAGAPAYLSAAGLTHVGTLIALGLTGAISVATFNAAVAAL